MCVRWEDMSMLVCMSLLVAAMNKTQAQRVEDASLLWCSTSRTFLPEVDALQFSSKFLTLCQQRRKGDVTHDARQSRFNSEVDSQRTQMILGVVFLRLFNLCPNGFDRRNIILSKGAAGERSDEVETALLALCTNLVKSAMLGIKAKSLSQVLKLFFQLCPFILVIGFVDGFPPVASFTNTSDQ